MKRRMRKITDKMRLDWLLNSDALYRKPKYWWGENYTNRREIDRRILIETGEKKK